MDQKRGGGKGSEFVRMMNRRRWVGIAAGVGIVVLVGLVWMQRPKSVEYEAIEIPLPVGFASFGNLRINDYGVVAGTLIRENDENDHLFLWDRKNGLRDLGDPGFALGQGWLRVNDINKKEQLIGEFGFYVSDDGDHFRGNTQSVGCFFFDPETGFHEIGGLKGFWSPNLSAVNDRGQVVGYCFRRSSEEAVVSRIFLWNWQSGTVDPNLVGWPSDINNFDHIVGINGKTSYVWTMAGKVLDRISNASDGYVLADHITDSDEVTGSTYEPFVSGSLKLFQWNRIDGYRSFQPMYNHSFDDYPIIAWNGREVLFYQERKQFDWFGLIDEPQVHTRFRLYRIGKDMKTAKHLPRSNDIHRQHWDMNEEGWLVGIVKKTAYVMIPKGKGKKEGD